MELDEEKKSSDDNSEGFCSSDDELDPYLKNKPVMPKVIVLSKTTNKTIDNFPEVREEKLKYQVEDFYSPQL